MSETKLEGYFRACRSTETRNDCTACVRTHELLMREYDVLCAFLSENNIAHIIHHNHAEIETFWMSPDNAIMVKLKFNL